VLAARPDRFSLIAGEAHVALAVSGGSDSMALLRLAEAWTRGRSRQPRLSILTVDHALRAGSASEARQVAAWAAALGADHQVLVWTGPRPATGIQAKARQARYDLMTGWCRNHGATVLMTAHTLDDQAETVLMRLARTSSLDSLAGIHRWSVWNGIKLFRPLLGERRVALREFLASVDQPWIDDPSNADERFERVRVRKIMPLLAEGGITAETLSGLASEAADVSQALWAAAREWVERHGVEHDSGYGAVPIRDFGRQAEALRTRILGCLIGRYGGGKLPEPAELGLLSAWLATASAGRRTLGGAVIARRSREFLVGREPGRIDPAPVTVPASGQVIWDGRFEIHAPPGCRVRPLGQTGRQPRQPELPAFVQAGLPAIETGGTGWVIPQLTGEAGVTARFRPDLRS